MTEQFEEGQIVLCTVDKIAGTTVFVKIEGDGEGTITTSEIAPGRIRNLRAYVVPGKKIVCKILSLRDNRIHLSLRRVKQNEKKELLDKLAKEKSYSAIIKTVSGKEKAKEIIDKISQTENIVDFLEKTKTQPEILNQYFSKTDSEKIIKILETKKEKPKEIKQKFNLSSNAPDGIKIIKQIIKTACKDIKCSISYLAAGKYRLNLVGEDFKKLKTQSNLIFKTTEKLARKKDCEFELVK